MAMPRRPPRHHNLNSSAGLSTAASALILSADRPFAGGRPNWPPLEARSFAPHLPRTAAGRTRKTLQRDWMVEQIPYPRQETRLPEVLSFEEVSSCVHVCERQ